MSATTHATKSFTLAPNFTLRTLLQWTQAAIEAYARYRARSAVSPLQIEQVEREMRRYRRSVRAGR
jgi:hypothetical protein